MLPCVATKRDGTAYCLPQDCSGKVLDDYVRFTGVTGIVEPLGASFILVVLSGCKVVDHQEYSSLYHELFDASCASQDGRICGYAVVIQPALQDDHDNLDPAIRSENHPR